MGSSSRPPQNTTTVQSTELPAYVRPYAQQLVERANALSQTVPNQKPWHERFVPMNSDQEEALRRIRSRAVLGDNVSNQAHSSVADTLRGNYLESNPYMDRAIQKSQQEALDIYQKVMKPELDSRAVRARAFGSSGYEDALGDMQEGVLEQIGDIGVSQRSQMYDSERARQLAAVQYTPMLSQQAYQDAQMLFGAGDEAQNQRQQMHDMEYQDFLEREMRQYQQLDVLAGGISGALGSGAGQTILSGPNPYRSNPLAGAVGGGLLGYGLSQAGGQTTSPYSFPLSAAGALLGAYYS